MRQFSDRSGTRPDFAVESLPRLTAKSVNVAGTIERPSGKDATHPTLCDRCVEAVQ